MTAVVNLLPRPKHDESRPAPMLGTLDVHVAIPISSTFLICAFGRAYPGQKPRMEIGHSTDLTTWNLHSDPPEIARPFKAPDLERLVSFGHGPRRRIVRRRAENLS